MSINETIKITKEKLVIADLTPNENDKDRFVDKYMQVKQDGHMRFQQRIFTNRSLPEISEKEKPNVKFSTDERAYI